MNLIPYLVSVLISFIGVMAGIFISKNIPETAHYVKKYFPMVQMISLVLLFFVLYSFFPFFIVTLILVLSFAFIRFFWEKQDVNLLDYIVFGVIFPFSSIIVFAQIYVTTLFFFFGIFSGALFFVLHTEPEKLKIKKSTKKYKKIIKASKDVAYHKHKGRHHTSQEIFSKALQVYSIFIIVAIVSYVASRLFSLVI